MLQISTSGGLRGLGTAFDDALTLQMAANRYATSVGKARIGEDHVIGPLTVALVRAALQFLVSRGQPEAASMLAAQAVSVSTLKAAAANVADYLNTSMDAIKLGGGAPATTSGSSWAEWFGLTPNPALVTLVSMLVLALCAVAQPSKLSYYTPAQMAQRAARQTTLKYALIGGGVLVALLALVLLMPKKSKTVPA